MYLKSKTRKSRRYVVATVASLGFAFVPHIGSAQNVPSVDAEQAGYSELTSQIINLVQRGNVVQAIPQMEELATRIEGGPEDQKEALESLYFYLGVGYMESAGTEGETAIGRAVEWFTKYIERFPQGGRIHLALSNRGDCYRALGSFREASEDFIRLLTPPEDQFEDMALRIDAHEKLTQCFYVLEDWDAGIPWFQRFLNITADEEKQAYAAGALIRAYIAKDMFDDMMKLLPLVIKESPIRYDVALNVELLKGGDKLVALGRVQEASLLYYLAQTGEEIIAYLNRRLQEDEKALRLLQTIAPNSVRIPELETNIFNYNTQIKQIQELPDFTPDLKWRLARTFESTGRNLEAFWAFSRLIEEYPEHDNREDFMYASFMQARKAAMMDYAFEIGEKYLGNDKYRKYAKEISVMMAEIYLEQKNYDKFFELAYRGVERFSDDSRFAPQFIFLIGSTLINLEKYEELNTRFDEYEKKYSKNVMIEGVYYWNGLANVFLENYDSALTKFRKIINDHTGGTYYEDARFRVGVIQFATDKMEDAYQTLMTFVDHFPKSNLRGEAEAFLGDITGSVAKVPQALRHYQLAEEWTNKTTQNMGFINHSIFQRGKLYEANKRYEEMAALFERYINEYRDRGDITSAVFQLGRAKEFLGRPEEMLSDFLNAISRFGNEPSSFGIDDIIATYPEKYREYEIKIATNLELREKIRNDEQFRTSLVNDRRFQYDTFKEMRGVDADFKSQLARDLEFREGLLNDQSARDEALKQYERMKAAFPDRTPVESFRRLFEEAVSQDRTTLALRLQMALDKMGAQVGSRSFTREDIEVASPATLVWIAGIVQEVNPRLAVEALRMVLELYSDSDYVFDALLALGDIEAENGDWNAALANYQDAEARFPAAPDVTDSILRQADALIALSRYGEAEQILSDVQRRRGVGAAIRAEASYKIGTIYYEQGEFDRAHAFFQRTYVAFPSFTKWAGQAYLQAGQTLERLGRSAEAKATYQEFLELPDIASREPELFREVQSRSTRL